jgi:hypothetical protein
VIESIIANPQISQGFISVLRQAQGMGPLSSAMGEYMKIYEYLPENPRNV